MAALPKDPLVWIDCEMTGLDPDSDVILEIYCYITDGQLRLVKQVDAGGQRNDPGWGAVVHVDKARLDQMGEWCTSQHGRSGLTKAVLESAVTPEQAADGLLAYIKKFVPEPGRGLLAGSTVHADKAFLRRPPYDRVLDHLHYRILDVSSIKEAARRWAPLPPRPPRGQGPAAAATTRKPPPHKMGSHRAQGDILESIEEAQYYKAEFFDAVNEGK